MAFTGAPRPRACTRCLGRPAEAALPHAAHGDSHRRRRRPLAGADQHRRRRSRVGSSSGAPAMGRPFTSTSSICRQRGPVARVRVEFAPSPPPRRGRGAPRGPGASPAARAPAGSASLAVSPSVHLRAWGTRRARSASLSAVPDLGVNRGSVRIANVRTRPPPPSPDRAVRIRPSPPSTVPMASGHPVALEGDHPATHVLVELLGRRHRRRGCRSGGRRGGVLPGQRRQGARRRLLSRGGRGERRDRDQRDRSQEERRALHEPEHSAPGRCKGRSAAPDGDTFWASVW